MENQSIFPDRMRYPIIFRTIPIIFVAGLFFLQCSAPPGNRESSVHVSVHRYLKDSSARFPALFSASADHFEQIPGPIVPLDLHGQSAWIRIDLTTGGEFREVFLDGGPVPLHVASMYSVQPGDPIERAREYKLNFPDRLMIPVSLSPDGRATVYIKMLSRIPVHLNIQALSREDWYHLRVEEKVISAIFITIVVILVLYFAFLLGMLRDFLFFYFILFSVAQAGYYLYFSGLLLDIFPGIAANRIAFVSGLMIVGVMNLIVNRFFHMKEMAPIMGKILLLFTILFGVEFFIFLFFPTLMIRVYFVSNIINGIIILLLMGEVIYRGSRPERFLASILILGQSGGFLSVFYHSGILGLIIPAWNSSETLFHFVFYSGMIVTMAIFSIFFIVGFSIRMFPAPAAAIQPREEASNLEVIRDIVSPGIEPDGLDEALVSQIEERFHALMEEDRVYLEPDLTVRKLARRMSIQPWNLSSYLNRYRKISFRDMLMEYRVREAAKMIRSEKEWTILRIAMESGFDSKATFNRAFQKVMGMTPTEYRKKESHFAK